MWHGLSFRTRLSLLALLTSGLGAIAAVLFLVQEWDVAQARAYDIGEHAALRIAGATDAALLETESALASLSTRPEVQRLDPSACGRLLELAVAMRPELTTLTVRRLDTALVCSSLANATPKLASAEADRLQAALRTGRLEISSPQQGEVTKRWISRLSYPIRNPDGQVVGMLLAPLDLGAFGRELFNGLPAGMIASLQDQDRRFVARSEDAVQWIGKQLPEVMRSKLLGREGRFKVDDLVGISRIGFYTSLDRAPWIAVAGVPEDLAFGPVRRHVILTGLFLGAALVLALGFALALARTIASPLRGIADVALRVGQGDTSARAMPDGGGPEIRELSRQFNRMLDELEADRVQREAMERHIETLVRNARDIVLLAGEDQRIVEANDAALVAYGRSREALGQLLFDDLRHESARGTASTWERAAASPDGALFDDVHQNKEGTAIPVEVSARILDIEGRRYLQAFVRDVTVRRSEQRQLELLSLAAQQARAGMLIADGEGHIAYVNQAYVRARGTSREALVGQHLNTLDASALRPDGSAGASLAVLAGYATVWEGELAYRHGGGATEAARTWITPLNDRDGHVSRFVLLSEEPIDVRHRIDSLEARCRALQALVAPAETAPSGTP